MAKALVFSCFVVLLFTIISSPLPTNATSGCNRPCRGRRDCIAPLVCLNGTCDDDPQAKIKICKGKRPPPPPPPKASPSPPPPPPPKKRCPPPPPPTNKTSPPPPPPPPTNQSSPPPPPPPRRRSPPPPPPSPKRPPPPPTCRPSGTVRCRGQNYPTFNCSPPVYSSTKARLTYKNFNDDGHGRPSTCKGKYYRESEPVVALSTGWYAGGSRCGMKIKITTSEGKRSTTAEVVDECNSRSGCNRENRYPPCGNDFIAGSEGVFRALKIDKDDNRLVNVTWSTA